MKKRKLNSNNPLYNKEKETTSPKLKEKRLLINKKTFKAYAVFLENDEK